MKKIRFNISYFMWETDRTIQFKFIVVDFSHKELNALGETK